MATQDLAAALRRVESVLRRRPAAGVQDDTPATACWEKGTRVVSRHANGTLIPTDMPAELGGSGDQVTLAWLMRAGLASCVATAIAMKAATDGIELDALEVVAGSRTDARGMLGVSGADGEAVSAVPLDVQLRVRIAARRVAPERLRAIVAEGTCRSPVFAALEGPLPVAVHVEVDVA